MISKVLVSQHVLYLINSKKTTVLQKTLDVSDHNKIWVVDGFVGGHATMIYLIISNSAYNAFEFFGHLLKCIESY